MFLFYIILCANCISVNYGFKCVGNSKCPTLLITTQHTIWTSTDFQIMETTNSEKETEIFITNGSQNKIGIPEEVIITKSSNTMKVSLEKAVAFVVLRHKFVECLLEWVNAYKIVLLDDRDIAKEFERTAALETLAIVKEIEQRYFGGAKIITTVLTQMPETLPENWFVLTTIGKFANVSQPPICVEPYIFDRLLESSNEDIFANISADLVKISQLKNISKDFHKSVEAINSMSWRSDAKYLESYNLEDILKYKVTYTKETLLDIVIQKIANQIGDEFSYVRSAIHKLRIRKWLIESVEVGIVTDVIMRVTVKMGNKVRNRHIQFSYVDFNYMSIDRKTQQIPYVISISELLSASIIDYPRVTPRILNQRIPELVSLENNSQLIEPIFSNVIQKRPTLVISLSTILSIYHITTTTIIHNKVLKVILIITDYFTKEDIATKCPTVHLKYGERISDPNNAFTVTYEEISKKPGESRLPARKTIFVVLTEGIIADLFELQRKYNLVLTSNLPQIMEKPIVDALERKFGKIFCRRFTNLDYNKQDCLKQFATPKPFYPLPAINPQEFSKDKTVHIHENALKIREYLYGLLIDGFNPCSPSKYIGLSAMKAILLDELHPALMMNNDSEIRNILANLQNLKFNCINNPNCPNLIISIRNLQTPNSLDVNGKISDNYLHNWAKYFNIIPWLPNENMDYTLLELKSTRISNILSVECKNVDEVKPNAIFIAENPDEILEKFRTQTILKRHSLHFFQKLDKFLMITVLKLGIPEPCDSIEAFNFRKPLQKDVAEKLLGVLPSVEEIQQIPVMILKYDKYCFQSLKTTTKGFNSQSIENVSKTYAQTFDRTPMIRTNFTLNGLNGQTSESHQVSLVSHLTLSSDEIHYLVVSEVNTSPICMRFRTIANKEELTKILC